MRIVMIGQRGVPATFGGIERHVEEVGAALVSRGHEVTVFCRSNYVQDSRSTHRGMTLCGLQTVGTKHLDAICHSVLSSAAALRSGFDVVHYHALGPGLAAPLPRWLSTARVVQTVHGRDDQRAKWAPPARAVLKLGSWMSARVPDSTIVVSQDLAAFYRRCYHQDVRYIPNGVTMTRARRGAAALNRFGLQPGRYLLFVGRLVPEKAPDMLIKAFGRIAGDLKLVVVGGSSFSSSYVTTLERLASADSRVCLTGFQYGPALEELYANAAAFVNPSSLEGMPLTLLDAAGSGTPVVASDIAPHLEVLGRRDGPGRRLFRSGDESDLLGALGRALADPVRERFGASALRDEVLAAYQWDQVAEATEAVYEEILRRGLSERVA